MNTALAAPTCRDLMAQHVITARPYETLTQARALMHEYHISALPVVDARDRLLGVVTTSDLMAEHPETTSVQELMSRRVHTVREHMDACVAARIMLKGRIHHVLVIDARQRVVGVLSSFDFLRLVPGCRHASSAERQAWRGSGSSAERRSHRSADPDHDPQCEELIAELEQLVVPEPRPARPRRDGRR